MLSLVTFRKTGVGRSSLQSPQATQGKEGTKCDPDLGQGTKEEKQMTWGKTWRQRRRLSLIENEEGLEN